MATEITTAQPEAGVWVEGPDGELIPDYESTFPEINEGQVVHGTVVRVDKDEVLVDIGYKSEGVIPTAELSIRRSVNPADEVAVGEEIDALVLTKEDTEGRLILSKKRARFELAWKRIEGAAESGEPVEGRVIEVVKGGLILDLGVRGFLPASLVDIRRVQDLDEFLGQTLSCKVIELNRSRNNVVLSRRAVLEDERKEMRQAILDRLNPGDVVEGQISNIVDFGAFVDLDGMDGLIHISELSWSHVNHPSEVLEIGQTVKVKVLDIDRERQRISLGLKQTQSDPWQQVLESYGEGDVVDGKVTKVVTFGAFVEILPGVEGLVHISELAQHHVENPREVVAQAQDVKVLILEVDAERRRLSLSMKRVEGGQPSAGGTDEDEGSQLTPNLGLSEEVFAEGAGARSAPEDAIADEPAAEAAIGEESSAASSNGVEPEAATIDERPEAATIDEEPEPATIDEEPEAATIDERPEAATIDEEPEPATIDEEPEPAAMIREEPEPVAESASEPEAEAEPALEEPDAVASAAEVADEDQR
jgi:small subunit ribosomal protein S1